MGIDTKVYFVDEAKPFAAGLLAVMLGKSVDFCFFQDKPSYTAQSIAVLRVKTKGLKKYVSPSISELIRCKSQIKYFAFGVA